MFKVDLSSSSEGEPESEASASEESSESSYSAEYTYLTDSGSEKEAPRNAARKTLGNFAARTREREERKGGERQDKKADKEQGLRKTAKGDLSAVEELEEDYESYHKKGRKQGSSKVLRRPKIRRLRTVPQAGFKDAPKSFRA